MSKELLPLGTVVYLQEGSAPVVIVAIAPFIEHQEKEEMLLYYDYTGVPAPAGAIGEDIYYFNHENVAKIIHVGYKSENHERYLESVSEWQEKNKDKFEIGAIE